MGRLNELSSDEKKVIITKLGKFKQANKFFQRAQLYEDEMLFKIYDYLINCYYLNKFILDQINFIGFLIIFIVEGIII